MSEHPRQRTLRILSGENTANLVVENQKSGPTAVPNSHSILIAQAREEAYREGEAAARREAEQTQEKLREDLQRLSEQLPANWERQMRDLETSFADAAIELAFKISAHICRGPQCRAETVRAAVSEALERPLLPESVQVRCHPEDAVILRNDASASSPSRTTIVEDANLAPGDVWIAACELGDFDGRLDTRLEILKSRVEHSTSP